MNVAGALFRPNGITNHAYKPSTLHPYLPILVDMGLDDHELPAPTS